MTHDPEQLWNRCDCDQLALSHDWSIIGHEQIWALQDYPKHHKDVCGNPGERIHPRYIAYFTPGYELTDLDRRSIMEVLEIRRGDCLRVMAPDADTLARYVAQVEQIRLLLPGEHPVAVLTPPAAVRERPS